MLLRRFAFAIVATAALVSISRADVKPHVLFSDNMVLQRDVKVNVWGKADPGEDVSVDLQGEGGGVSLVGKANEKGMWTFALPEHKAGTGYTLTVKGKNTVTFKNVAYGDVWICSGQSNMEWQFYKLTKDDQHIKTTSTAKNANIRLFTVPRLTSMKPEYDFPRTTQKRGEAKVNFGQWEEATPESVMEFSAVGYYFGREIEKSQKVPVGLLASNWGGTPCEAWTSQEVLDADPNFKEFHERLKAQTMNYDAEKADAKFKDEMEKWKVAAAAAKEDGKPAPRAPTKTVPFNQNSPSTLYNAMIAPLLPFPIKGAIWYQGETNAGRAAQYYSLYPAMISDWRKRWGSEIPFFGVQLAPFKADGVDKVSYAELRDAQFAASKKLPKVGYATISDVGDENDIHPQRKEAVGVRLALSARAIAYGEKIESSGPVYKSVKIDGAKATLTFDHVGKGLACTGDKLTGFTVCGEDKKFVPATAEIVGDTVVVKAEGVEKPVAVRFGWVNFAKPELNFGNKDGLPTVPFRTDDFPLTTKAK